MASIAAALLVASALLWITGFDPQGAVTRLVTTSFGSNYSIGQTAQQIAPILLCATGIAFAARLGLWNIGAEGQFYLGALATVAVFQYFPLLPWYLMLPAMMTAGIAGGILWMAVPALLSTFGGVSIILTTLLMNYVAFPLVNFFIYGPWKSPGAFNFPVTNRFTDNAFLPMVPGLPVHAGFVIAIVLAAAADFLLWHTTFGFRVRAIGNNRSAATYLGYPTSAIDISVLFVSGGLAGLAGMVQVSGLTHQLLPNVSPGYGYLGIIVASLALKSIRGCIAVSVGLAIILVGSKGMETTGIPGGFANFLSGLLLFFALIGVALSSTGGFFAKSNIRSIGKKSGSSGE